MDDLVTWLRAQLDKDQEITEKVRADAVAIRRAGSLAPDPTEADRYDRQVRWATADNESKRKILDLWEEEYGIRGASGDLIPRYLALPYAGRPGYREEWKP